MSIVVWRLRVQKIGVFGYKFRYRHQFGLFTLDFAKPLVIGDLERGQPYGQLRLFIIDIQYSRETQNPPRAASWGFDTPLPAPRLLVILLYAYGMLSRFGIWSYRRRFPAPKLPVFSQSSYKGESVLSWLSRACSVSSARQIAPLS